VELCPKFVREHGIELLENGCLVLKCASMRGVFMKKWHVLGLDNVESVFERSTSVVVHSYDIV
jgi:hypothetical protein